MAAILLVDDREDLATLTRRVLEREGHRCDVAHSIAAAERALAERDQDLVICDLLLEDGNAVDFIGRVTSLSPATVLMVVTAVDEPSVADDAIRCGVYGYLVKPVEPHVLLINVNCALRRRRLELQARRSSDELTQLVQRRTEALMATIDSLRTRNRENALLTEEVIYALSTAAEFRGLRLSAHTYRVGRFASLLASRVGLPQEDVDIIRAAATLHDIGNVAIARHLLAKPGPLSEAELAEVQAHARIGYELLRPFQAPLLQCAGRIALSHHERWDGSGYPDRLHGDEIPIEARLTAVADVFDSLTRDRPHRSAVSTHEALAHVSDNAGTLFDPEIVAALRDEFPEILRLRAKYDDNSTRVSPSVI